MLATIHLDDQPSLAANKISDVRFNRDLANKLVAAQAAITQRKPQVHFGVGR
jgi:hypothetical protein